ncbi:MAG: hypothetical protein ABR954_10610 [Dehalococcoidales bacterium]
MNQFNIAFTRLSADGKKAVVHVVDRDFDVNCFTNLPSDVHVMESCDHDSCAAVLEVPAKRLCGGGNVVDLS